MKKVDWTLDDMDFLMGKTVVPSGGRLMFRRTNKPNTWKFDLQYRESLQDAYDSGFGEKDWKDDYVTPVIKKFKEELKHYFDLSLFEIEVGEDGFLYVGLSTKGKYYVKNQMVRERHAGRSLSAAAKHQMALDLVRGV